MTVAAARRNPFATRHTRPGRVAPRTAAGAPVDVAHLAARGLDLRRAAIEGPHGAGKTNLLEALARHLAAAGRLAGSTRARSWADGPAVLGMVRRAAPGATVCIDSWEALGPAWRGLVRRAAAWRGVGLLVTCHRARDLPVLVRCTTTPALLAGIVADLPDHGGLIRAADIEDAFTARRGNLREALYDLYDRFERRARR